MKKIEILLISLLIMLLIFAIDFNFSNIFSHVINAFFDRISVPFFYLKNFVNLSCNKVETKIIVFEEIDNALIPLNITNKGIYFYNLDSTGIVLSTDKKLVGFAKKSGKFVFVKKWWYDEFKVTIINQQIETEGYFKNGKVEIFDNIKIEDAEIYLSKEIPYGTLLYNEGVLLGKIKNGKLFLNIPQLSIKTQFLLLNYYTQLGGDINE